MRHYHVDWDEITLNFEQEQAENGLWHICDALQKIETVYDSDTELKGLNLPLYSFVATAYSLDTEKSAAHVCYGWKTAVLPLKKIGVIQEVIPCHRSHAVIAAVLKAENVALANSEANDTAKYNLHLRHISVLLEHGLGHYEVITTRTSHRELEAAWLRSIG